jgi:dTDP-4-amino-4,6-dideoxygalactose transaminase
MSASAKTRISFADLGRAAAEQRAELETAISRVLDSGRFILGEEGYAFERELARALGADHAVGVASGTDAIELALRALGIGQGCEVITQASTCVPTVAAIARCGATPVLCDVDLASATMDPASLAEAVSASTRAVLPVHLYGQCADMEAIGKLARDRRLAVVEDCAQALGARSPGGAAGTLGDAGAFSFYPTKNLGALGDAGAVVTADVGLAERIRSLSRYGRSPQGLSVEEGVNSRLDELQAAVLRARLPALEAANSRRRAIAAYYDEALAGTAVSPLARLSGHRVVFHLYVVRTTRRETFVDGLKRRGVETMVHYPAAVDEHPAYRALADGPTSLANAHVLAREVVSLPLYPELTDDEVEYVGTAARSAAGEL